MVIRCVDENKFPPSEYKSGSRILVGVKHISYMNPEYFFQHLALHFPHRQLHDILPISDNNIPTQIKHFYTSLMRMPEFFGNPFSGPHKERRSQTILH